MFKPTAAGAKKTPVKKASTTAKPKAKSATKKPVAKKATVKKGTWFD